MTHPYMDNEAQPFIAQESYDTPSGPALNPSLHSDAPPAPQQQPQQQNHILVHKNAQQHLPNQFPRESSVPGQMMMLVPVAPAPFAKGVEKTVHMAPFMMTCQKCGHMGMTRVEEEYGVFQYFLCLLSVCVSCFLGCCLIPFCISSFKDHHHHCKKCEVFVAVKKIM